jgi:uncharacterized YigZ family protein
MNFFYKTIETRNTTEFKDRGSKFIGEIFPLPNKASFKEIMTSVKMAHPKADHFCFAYRLGLDKTDFRVSDAGEPSGTAGKPILGQIDSKELTNVLIVVIRYFGGTLLGVPGLINAYKTTASMLVQTTEIVQKEQSVPMHIELDYTKMNDAIKIIKQFRGIIKSNDASLFAILKIEVPVAEMEMMKQNLLRIGAIVTMI